MNANTINYAKAFFLKILQSPVFLGFLFVLAVSSYSYFSYYPSQYQVYRSGLNEALIRLNHQILDYRLRFRGPRKGSPDVAILAVDDRSIDVVGRWPWPRDQLALAIDQAFEHGAQVIASDIVWSEASDRPELRFYEDLKKTSKLSADLQALASDKLEEQNPDRMLAEILANRKEGFVLGSFGEASFYVDLPGFVTSCTDLAFRLSREYYTWDNDEILTVALDDYERHLPFGLSHIIEEEYQNTFFLIANEVRESRPFPTTEAEFHDLDREIQLAQMRFCEEIFLEPDLDPTFPVIRSRWDEVLSINPEISQSSFEEWVASFTSGYAMSDIQEYTRWTMNIPLISQSMIHNGSFNATLDRDGVLRRNTLIMRTGSTHIPSIGLKAFSVASSLYPNFSMTLNPYSDHRKSVDKFYFTHPETGEKKFEVPVSHDGKLIINYAGPGRTFPHASIVDLLNKDAPDILVLENVFDKDDRRWKLAQNRVPKSEFFKNKTLVLGVTSVGVFDLRVTPFDENFPGVETHANVIDNLKRQDFLYSDLNETTLLPIFTAVLGLILSLMLSYFGALAGLVIAAASFLSLIIFDYKVLFSQGLIVSIFIPLFTISFLYILITFYKYFTEERSKIELRKTFSKYVSPQVVDEILKDPENVQLGGKKAELSILFSDIRNFTSISEKLDPKELSSLLNNYLTPMTHIVFKNKGTLDKYMGDAIMAFFGAPIPLDDHPLRAGQCAIESIQNLKILQEEFKKKGLPHIDVGIGINSGIVSVGNMGSETVRSYTVMGDAVNLASRLEGLTKEYGVHIIISEYTHKHIQGHMPTRELDLVKVKGKSDYVRIYELISESQLNANSPYAQSLDAFKKAYALYREKNFEDASSYFKKALELRPHDAPSRLYLERCENYLVSPPPQDWDGVYVMTTK